MYLFIEHDASAQVPAVPTFDPTPPSPTITIDQRPPVLNNNLVLTVRDYSLANNQHMQETIQVLLENTRNGAANSITLTEIDDTGVFVLKYIKFTTTPGQNDLLASVGDSIRASYRNAIVNDNVVLTFADQVLQKTLNTETIACAADNDGDKLCDEWETPDGLSITFPGSSTTYTYPCDPVCPDPLTRDVYVEVDYMNGHDPDLNAIKQVKDAFASAGVNLHVQIDENVMNHKDTTKFPGSNSRFPTNAGFDQIKERWHGSLIERSGSDAAMLWKEKKQAFHYALFVHKFAGDLTMSGIAEKSGNDLMISLGSFTGSIGSTDEQAATFMHELGHNLGLDHGGPIAVLQDSQVNCKPNYISIMSYSRQFRDLINDRELDYSRSAVNGIGLTSGPLSESQLTESGLTAYPGTPRIVYGPIPPIELPRADNTSHIDWNLDSYYTSDVVQADANNLLGCQSASSADTFQTTSDWTNLNFDFRSRAEAFGSGVSVNALSTDTNYAANELTIDEVKKNRELRVKTIQCFLNLNVNDCPRPHAGSHADYLDATPIQISPVQYSTDTESTMIKAKDSGSIGLKENSQNESIDNSVKNEGAKQPPINVRDEEIYNSQDQNEINEIKQELLTATEEIKGLTTDYSNPDESLSEAIVKLNDLRHSLQDKLKPDAYDVVSKNIDDVIASYTYALDTQPNTHSDVRAVSPQDMACPSGTHLNQEFCVPDVECETGYHVEDETCVPTVECQPGYHVENGTCKQDVPLSVYAIPIGVMVAVAAYYAYRNSSRRTYQNR